MPESVQPERRTSIGSGSTGASCPRRSGSSRDPSRWCQTHPLGHRVDGNSEDATGCCPQEVQASGGRFGEHLLGQLEEMAVKAEQGILHVPAVHCPCPRRIGSGPECQCAPQRRALPLPATRRRGLGMRESRTTPCAPLDRPPRLPQRPWRRRAPDMPGWLPGSVPILDAEIPLTRPGSSALSGNLSNRLREEPRQYRRRPSRRGGNSRGAARGLPTNSPGPVPSLATTTCH